MTDEEAVVVCFEDDDDYDDDFAELFSFATAPAEVESSPSKDASQLSNTKSMTDYKEVMTSVMPLPPTHVDDDSHHSEDSLLELLEQQKEPITVLDAASVSKPKGSSTTKTVNSTDDENDDSGIDNMQEILDWLDQDDDYREAARLQDGEEEIEFLPPSLRPPPVEQEITPTPAPEPEPQFETLEEAVKSPNSSLVQIRTLLQKENYQVSAAVRPHLWCRVICGKTLQDTLQSSVADSFYQWEEHNQSLLQGKDTIVEDTLTSTLEEGTPAAISSSEVESKVDLQGEECGKNTDSAQESSSQPTAEDSKESSSNTPVQIPSKPEVKVLTPYQKAQRKWIQEQSNVLADRIVTVLRGEKSQSQQALTSILLNHYHTGTKPTGDDDYENMPKTDASMAPDQEGTKKPSKSPAEYEDPLLPPVACTILAAGVPKAAAAVMLSHIVPNCMPILALTAKEREQAATNMHRQFYLLACYHLPSLVLHLDRYFPNWYLWTSYPAKKKEGPGFIPDTYLMSYMAGECSVISEEEDDGGDATANNPSKSFMMNPRWVLALWDLILTSSNSSFRFFLVLAVLESHAPDLVLLTDDVLKEQLIKVLRFQQDKVDGGVFSVQDSESDTSSQDARQWVQDLTDKAQKLWEHTPLSISRRLKRVEDQAVTEALTKRQQEAEVRLQRKLEAQAKAYQEAVEAERERKADEARLRLTRARLVAFYRQYNPGKETNIDKIMEAYQGRYEVLDSKLKQKYGVGFNPALKQKSAPVRNNTIAKTTNSIVGKDENEDDLAKTRKRNQIVPKVAPSEILPNVCWSKKANKVRLAKLQKGNKLEDNEETRLPLRFFLVDSRPVETAKDQGRFPTSVSFPPEDFTDPDRLKQQEEMFEVLRAANHIVIMGEGFAALPGLYGHKLTAGLAECIRQDDARNNNCALFFLKKGFPFVSVLDGGFAGAHAFLYREGRNHHLRVNDVLADYNPEISIFGQFERVRNSTGREKAQRALQNIFDSSIVVLTKNSRRLETLASELGGEEKKTGNMVARFFAGGGGQDATKKSESAEDGSEPPSITSENKGGPAGQLFRNPFSRLNHQHPSNKLTRENSNTSLVVESVDDLDSDKSGHQVSGPALNDSGLLKPGVAMRQDSNTLSANQPKPPIPQPKPAEPKRNFEPPKSNPFAGFGAAFKAASKVAAGDGGSKGIVGINPFARFNQQGRNLDKSQHGMSTSRHGLNTSQHGMGSSQHGKKTENHGPGINFSGFNQFRMNTFSRMRNPGDNYPNDGSTQSHNDAVTEESVSFDQTSKAVTPSTEPEK